MRDPSRYVTTFEDLRPLLFSIAYRMLGSVAEAEDIVQDAFLRYHRALAEHAAEIESPKAYLSAVTTRLAIDHLRSARVRKERYVGEWLPEPLLTDETAPDAARARRGRRLAVDGFPAGARAALARSSAPSSCCTTSSTTATTRSPASSARTRTTAASSPHAPGATSTRTGRASRPRGESATSSPPGSSTRSATATWTVWSSCSRPTSSSMATVAGTARRGGSRSSAATGCVRLMLGIGRHAREQGVTMRRTEVNGQPGAMFLDASGG